MIKATFVNYSSSGLPGYPPFSAFQKLLHPLLEKLIDDILVMEPENLVLYIILA